MLSMFCPSTYEMRSTQRIRADTKLFMSVSQGIMAPCLPVSFRLVPSRRNYSVIMHYDAQAQGKGSTGTNNCEACLGKHHDVMFCPRVKHLHSCILHCSTKLSILHCKIITCGNRSGNMNENHCDGERYEQTERRQEFRYRIA